MHPHCSMQHFHLQGSAFAANHVSFIVVLQPAGSPTAAKQQRIAVGMLREAWWRGVWARVGLQPARPVATMQAHCSCPWMQVHGINPKPKA